MIRMSTKQKIILHRYRDGYSERRIARKLEINRETVRRYLSEYEKSRQNLSNAEKEDEVLIEELVKVPKYDSSNRDSKKFTDEISQEVDRLLQTNEEKRSRGLHKQLMKKIDILEHLHDLGYDIGYTSVCYTVSPPGSSCFSFRANLVDPIIEQKVIQVLNPDNVAIALSALSEMEKRNDSLNRQWEMNIQRCQYQADIAQRRFEQVDPANRLVAASLEKSWNRELEKLALVKSEYQQHQAKRDAEFTPHKKTQVSRLAKEIPTLWNKTTNLKDKK